MRFANFLKGPTTTFLSDDDLILSSSEYEIDPDDIILLLKNKGVNVVDYKYHRNTFYINNMYVKGHNHKSIIKAALQSLYHKLDITSEGTAYYATDSTKKLTMSTANDIVEVEFSKPKKKKKII